MPRNARARRRFLTGMLKLDARRQKTLDDRTPLPRQLANCILQLRDLELQFLDPRQMRPDLRHRCQPICSLMQAASRLVRSTRVLSDIEFHPEKSRSTAMWLDRSPLQEPASTQGDLDRACCFDCESGSSSAWSCGSAGCSARSQIAWAPTAPSDVPCPGTYGPCIVMPRACAIGMTESRIAKPSAMIRVAARSIRPISIRTEAVSRRNGMHCQPTREAAEHWR